MPRDPSPEDSLLRRISARFDSATACSLLGAVALLGLLVPALYGENPQPVGLYAVKASPEPLPTPASEVVVQIPGEFRVQELAIQILHSLQDPTESLETQPCAATASTTWRCRVPAGQRDLKLVAKGFAPQYFWNLVLEPGTPLQLGELRLARGASLAGWVVAEGKADPLATLRLRPHWNGWHGDPRTGRRFELQAAEIKAGPGGFFQFTGLASGEYQLTVSLPGFASAVRAPITLDDGREQLLSNPIVLGLPLRLELILAPATDPRGEPWRVRLLRLRRAKTVGETVGEGVVDAEGRVDFRELSPDDFELVVEDALQSTWLSRQLELRGPTEPLFIDIPRVEIAGRITLGGDPVVATLSFGSTQGRLDIRIPTDEEGRFTGFLPHEGTWPLEVIFAADTWTQACDPVEVRGRPGKRVVELELELPKTRVEGQVTFRGEPVAAADVVVVRDRENGRREAILKTDDKGFFQLRGVQEGGLAVRAYQLHRSSGWVSFAVSADQEKQLDLVLAETRVFGGQVLSATGPVAATNLAFIALLPGGQSDFQQLTSGPAGEFELITSAEAVAFDVVAVAAGHPAVWLRLPAPAKDPAGPLLLELEPAGGDLRIEIGEAAGARIYPHTFELRRNGLAVNLGLLWTQLQPASRAALHGGGFQLLGLAAGLYEVCHAARSGPVCASGTLAPHGELVLTVGGTAATRQQEAPP